MSDESHPRPPWTNKLSLSLSRRANFPSSRRLSRRDKNADRRIASVATLHDRSLLPGDRGFIESHKFYAFRKRGTLLLS